MEPRLPSGRWATAAMLLLLLALSGSIVEARPMGANMTGRAFIPFRVGRVTPQGWLLKQLELQAEGLGGHLAHFWDDVMNSVWIGGDADGGLHERVPYWLNGMVPLAFLLKNANSPFAYHGIKDVHQPDDQLCQANVDMQNHDITNFPVQRPEDCRQSCLNNTACVAIVLNNCTNPPTCWLKSGIGRADETTCRCFGVVKPFTAEEGIMNQTERFINHILNAQAASGWLGPDDMPTSGDMYWGNFPVLLSLAMYAEGNPTMEETIATAMLKFFQEANRRMSNVPMSDWSQARGMDFALAVQWVLENAPNGQEAFLQDFLATVQNQTLDWETWFQDFTTGASPHGVNNAQALKSSGVWYLSTGDPSFTESSKDRMRNMDDFYGMASGMFCADEILCEANERKMPSRGTELCAVVEAMFSYNTLFSVHGDVAFADRAERIAYNALPATFASPRGGDMWSHQYLQGLNEINAQVSDDHVWTHDGGDAQLYGLAPNYGCCTANFGQGWPKFANMLLYERNDGSVAVGAYGPVAGTSTNGVFVNMTTEYPYGDTVSIAVHTNYSTTLHLRIPTWAHTAQVEIDGSAVSNITAGIMNPVAIPAGKHTVLVNLKPEIRLEHWYSEETVSVHRGALMYSLPIQGSYTTLVEYAYESNDYQVLPTSEWRYALDLDFDNITSNFEFSNPGLGKDLVAFNHTAWGATIATKGRVVPNWEIAHNAAAAPPASPVCDDVQCQPTQSITLVPYGGTDLRISEFPWA